MNNHQQLQTLYNALQAYNLQITQTRLQQSSVPMKNQPGILRQLNSHHNAQLPTSMNIFKQAQPLSEINENQEPLFSDQHTKTMRGPPISLRRDSSELGKTLSSKTKDKKRIICNQCNKPIFKSNIARHRRDVCYKMILSGVDASPMRSSILNPYVPSQAYVKQTQPNFLSQRDNEDLINCQDKQEKELMDLIKSVLEFLQPQTGNEEQPFLIDTVLSECPPALGGFVEPPKLLNRDQSLRKRDDKFEDKIFEYLVPPLWHKFKDLYEVNYELAEDGIVGLLAKHEHAIRQNQTTMPSNHPKTKQEWLNMFLLSELGFAFREQTFHQAQKEVIEFLQKYQFKRQVRIMESNMTMQDFLVHNNHWPGKEKWIPKRVSQRQVDAANQQIRVPTNKMQTMIKEISQSTMPFGPEVPFYIKNCRMIKARENDRVRQQTEIEKKRLKDFKYSERYKEIQNEQLEKQRQDFMNANPLKVFPFLQTSPRPRTLRSLYGGEVKPLFPSIKEQQQSRKWHTRNVIGINSVLFEMMCLKDFKDQFFLYRKFRPYKAPEDHHVVDPAVARRHNDEVTAKRARLYSVEQTIKMSYVPSDLQTWYTTYQKQQIDIFEREMPLITLVPINSTLTETTVELIKGWIKIIQLYLHYQKNIDRPNAVDVLAYLCESAEYREENRPHRKGILPLNFNKGTQDYVGFSQKYYGGLRYCLHLRVNIKNSTVIEVVEKRTYQEYYLTQLERQLYQLPYPKTKNEQDVLRQCVKEAKQDPSKWKLNDYQRTNLIEFDTKAKTIEEIQTFVYQNVYLFQKFLIMIQQNGLQILKQKQQEIGCDESMQVDLEQKSLRFLQNSKSLRDDEDILFNTRTAFNPQSNMFCFPSLFRNLSPHSLLCITEKQQQIQQLYNEYKIYKPIASATSFDYLRSQIHLSRGGQQVLARALCIKDRCSQNFKILIASMKETQHYMPQLLKDEIADSLRTYFIKRINYLFTTVLSNLMSFQNYATLKIMRNLYSDIRQNSEEMAMDGESGSEQNSTLEVKNSFLQIWGKYMTEAKILSNLTSVELIELFDQDITREITRADFILENRCYKWQFLKKDKNDRCDRYYGDEIDNWPIRIMSLLNRLEELQNEGTTLMSQAQQIITLIAQRIPRKRGPPFIMKEEYLVHKTKALLKDIQDEEGLNFAKHLVDQMLIFTRIALDPNTFFARGKGEQLMKQYPEKCQDQIRTTWLDPHKNTPQYWAMQQRVSKILKFNTDCRLDEVLLVSYRDPLTGEETIEWIRNYEVPTTLEERLNQCNDEDSMIGKELNEDNDLKQLNTTQKERQSLCGRGQQEEKPQPNDEEEVKEEIVKHQFDKKVNKDKIKDLKNKMDGKIFGVIKIDIKILKMCCTVMLEQVKNRALKINSARRFQFPTARSIQNNLLSIIKKYASVYSMRTSTYIEMKEKYSVSHLVCPHNKLQNNCRYYPNRVLDETLRIEANYLVRTALEYYKKNSFQSREQEIDQVQEMDNLTKWLELKARRAQKIARGLLARKGYNVQQEKTVPPVSPVSKESTDINKTLRSIKALRHLIPSFKVLEDIDEFKEPTLSTYPESLPKQTYSFLEQARKKFIMQLIKELASAFTGIKKEECVKTQNDTTEKTREKRREKIKRKWCLKVVKLTKENSGPSVNKNLKSLKGIYKVEMFKYPRRFLP